MEAAFKPPENSFTEFGSVILALIGRNVQFISELDNATSEVAGSVLADLLQQVYTKEPSAAWVGLSKQNKLALDGALQTARALSGTISISADTFRAEQQLAQHVCQVMLLQANCGTCGMPTAILAFTLKLLLIKAKQQNPPDAAANCQDVLSEQADLFIAAFKRVSAGKVFSQCQIHKSKDCCQLAQAELTLALSLLANYSYTAQHRLWDQGLLPFLVNNLRNASLQCKAAAVHLVALTLSAQIGPPLFEAAHLSNSCTCATISDAQMSSNSIKAQTFITRSFAALEEVLHSEKSGMPIAMLTSGLQLGTAALLWTNNTGSPLDSQLPWQFLYELVIHGLGFAVCGISPQKHSMIPESSGAINHVASLATVLLVTIAGRFLKAAPLNRLETEHIQQWFMPILSAMFETHNGDPEIGGVLVILAALVVGHPLTTFEQSTVNSSMSHKAVQTALNSVGMARLLGKSGQASKTEDYPENSLQGSMFGILCKQSKAGSYLLDELSALLAAWQVTAAWLPGDTGHSQKLYATQVWLKAKAIDYPALRYLQQRYGPPSTEVAPTQQGSASLQNAEVMPQSADGQHSLDDDCGIDRGALKSIREDLAGLTDIEYFKGLLTGVYSQLYEQCQQAAMAFAVAVKAMAKRGMLYTRPCGEVAFVNELWVSCGYSDIFITASTVLMQAKIIQVDFASCQALSDINDLSTAVLQQHDMLSAFKEVAVPKLNTWVVARVTGNNAQPAAMTQTASNSAVTPIHQFPPAAERRASAVAPAPEAAATPSASAEGLETAARSRSAENNRSYTMMQAGAGDPSRAPQDADVDKHAGQVLRWAVSQCLQADPKARPTAAELVKVLEPIADSHLLRSQSDGPASYSPTSRQEVSADGHEAPKGRASSGNGNAQPDGLQAIPNVHAASPELARALCQLHKDNERFDEIAQALDQEDLRGSLKSSSPRMHVGAPEAEGVANCLPSYLHLVCQLRLLPPPQQAQLVMLVASQPGMMATLALAIPSTHQAVHNIAKVQELDAEWSKRKEEVPLLDRTMQQLALVCSFALFQPEDAAKLPENLAKVWATLSQLPAEHRQRVIDIATMINSHMTMIASTGIPAASTAEKKGPSLQEAPPDSNSESDEEPPVQKALPTAPKPAKAYNKAAAPASKPTQPQTTPAATSLASSLADAMRPTSAVVNDGDQRAATKRLQLRNKLKRAHEAAGNQSTSQKAEPPVAEAEAIKADLTPPQDKQISSVPQSDAAESELPAVKPSRKMLKRERRRAAAAAAAETAASSDGLQCHSMHDPLDSLSTAEDTSGSSAASLVGSEAGTPPARGQAVIVQQGATADVSNGLAPSIAADDNASSNKGSMAAHDHAALTCDLPAADSSVSPASAPVQAGTMLNCPDAATTKSKQPDSNAVANGAEAHPAPTSTKPDVISKQTPDVTIASPVAASAHQAAAPDDQEPSAPPEQISNASLPTRSVAPSQASSTADADKMMSADTATGSSAGKHAGVQPLKPDSLAKQKVERLPSAAIAAASPPPPPAAIAAHRPAANVVLRASAAPYTPLSSKALLVSKTKAPANGAKPGPTASSSSVEDKGKKQVPAGSSTASAKAFVAPAAAAAVKAIKPAVTSSTGVTRSTAEASSTAVTSSAGAALRPGWKSAASSSGTADDKGKNTVPAASPAVLADDTANKVAPAVSSPGIAGDKGKSVVPTASSPGLADERGKANMPAASSPSAIVQGGKGISPVDVLETSGASKYSVHASAAAAAPGSPVSDSSKEGVQDPEAGLLLLDLIKPDKKRTPVASKPKRLFGMTTLAALRQRPQLAVLRQKEAQLSSAKAEQLRGSPPPRVHAVSDDTAGPSSAPLDLPLRSTDMAADSTTAGPSSATAAVFSDWNLAQSQGANQALPAGHGMPAHSNSAEPAVDRAAPATDGATSPGHITGKPQPKLAKNERHVHNSDQVAVTDDSAGPSSSEAAGAASLAAEFAIPALQDKATVNESGRAQVTQPQQAQQAECSQQTLQSAASGHAWGTASPQRHAPPGQIADDSFPPLSQARERRPKQLYQPAAVASSADTAGPSGHADAAELSFGTFAADTPSMAAAVRVSRTDHSQRDNDLGAAAAPSRQAQSAELQRSPPAEANAMLSRAESSLQASSSASFAKAASTTPAEAAAHAAPLVFGQRLAGRGPFQLSTELQMALSGKPKPGRGRGKAAVPLPEPSADLVLQRVLMEKPKPRPRPRRPPVTPQSTEAVMSDDAILLKLEEDYTCPITQDYFEDPVTAADDYTYERYAITDWLSKHNTSPMTNLPLPHCGLVSNGSIKVQMQALLQQLTPAKQVEVVNYLS